MTSIYVAGWLREAKNFFVCVVDQLSDHFGMVT